MSVDHHFDAVDALLRQPSRAVGGEPCVKCGSPVPKSAHWKHRDRHVCSPRCNSNLMRQLNRRLSRGEVVLPEPAEADLRGTRAEEARAPRLFSTVMSAEFPYEHGRYPKLGDRIERHGMVTAYRELTRFHPAYRAIRPYLAGLEMTADQVAVAELEGTDLFGLSVLDGTLMLPFFGVGDRLIDRSAVAEPLTPFGMEGWFGREIIAGVDEFDLEYRWRADVFAPVQPTRLWTPERHARSRAARARSSYLSRARAAGVVSPEADYVDPIAVYEACDWMCGICGSSIDRSLTHPDPWSVTLDHIQPVTAEGHHVRENLQAAHWWCNVVKGNS